MKDRVYLRAFEPEDYMAIAKWRNDREIAEKLGGGFLTSPQLAKRNGWKTQSSKAVM